MLGEYTHCTLVILSLTIVFLFPHFLYFLGLCSIHHIFSPPALFLYLAAIISLCVFLSSSHSPFCSFSLAYCQPIAHILTLLLSMTSPQTNINVIPVCAPNRIPAFEIKLVHVYKGLFRGFSANFQYNECGVLNSLRVT